MECKFCGEKLPEGAEKCPNCQIPVRSRQAEIQELLPETKKDEEAAAPVMTTPIESMEQRYERIERNTRKTRWIVTAVVTAVVIAVVCIVGFFFTGYRYAVRKYINGRESNSGYRYMSLVPEEFMDDLEAGYKLNRKSMRECVDGYFSYARRILENDVGGNVRFSYETTDVKRYTDAETIEEYADKVEKTYGVRLDIDKVVLANLRVSTAGNRSNIVDGVEVTLLHSGMHWYCMDAMEQVQFACQYEGYDLW